MVKWGAGQSGSRRVEDKCLQSDVVGADVKLEISDGIIVTKRDEDFEYFVEENVVVGFLAGVVEEVGLVERRHGELERGIGVTDLDLGQWETCLILTRKGFIPGNGGRGCGAAFRNPNTRNWCVHSREENLRRIEQAR